MEVLKLDQCSFRPNLMGYVQLWKSIVQTALKGRLFTILIGTSGPETMVSPIRAQTASPSGKIDFSHPIVYETL